VPTIFPNTFHLVAYDFVGSTQSELSVTKGEHVWIFQVKPEGDWCLGARQDKQMGWVPTSYLVKRTLDDMKGPQAPPKEPSYSAPPSPAQSPALKPVTSQTPQLAKQPSVPIVEEEGDAAFEAAYAMAAHILNKISFV